MVPRRGTPESVDTNASGCGEHEQNCQYCQKHADMPLTWAIRVGCKGGDLIAEQLDTKEEPHQHPFAMNHLCVALSGKRTSWNPEVLRSGQDGVPPCATFVSSAGCFKALSAKSGCLHQDIRNGVTIYDPFRRSLYEPPCVWSVVSVDFFHDSCSISVV